LEEFIPILIVNFFSLQSNGRLFQKVLNQTSLPSSPPSMSEMIAMIGSLGGHLGRKRDGPPGPQSIWIGLQRMRDFVLVLDAIKNAQQSTSDNLPIFT
jgi:hypothetical protein